VFQRFDAIVVVNTEQKAFFERLGCEPSRVQLILPYANPDPEAVARGELPPDVEEFLARHQHVVVTIGLLEPEYQLDLVISALPELRRVAGDIGLVIVGSGSLETELRGVIQRSPERAHVALLGDLAHAATLRLLLRADTMIRATKFDGDAISVREALALGTPVAATHTGMRPPGCHLFQVGSLEGLVTAVSRAMASPRRVFPSADELDRVVELYRVLAA
jgi:glycosyltransferase involved in cell wall biosynthesis